MSVAWVGAGISAVSAISGAKASKKAASAQAQAAADAQALQQQQYEQTREDNAPFRERGNQAGNRLQYLLGLDGSKGAPGMSSSGGLTGKELVTMNGGVPGMNQELYDGNADYRTAWDARDAEHRSRYGTSYTRDSDSGVLTQELRNLLADVYAREKTAGEAADQAAQQSPEFGSLLRKFTMADRDADPVYQSGLEFGLSEGRRAVDNRFAAAGSSLSGAALKALTRFGNDYASTKAGEARNRYVQDQDATYNRLAGVAGTGQTATRDVSNAGANYASGAGSAIMGGGEARAAGYLGQANAFNTGASQAIGGYQNNQLMELIRNPNGRNAMNNSIYSPRTGYGGWGGTSNEQFFYGNGGSGD